MSRLFPGCPLSLLSFSSRTCPLVFFSVFLLGSRLPARLSLSASICLQSAGVLSTCKTEREASGQLSPLDLYVHPSEFIRFSLVSALHAPKPLQRRPVFSLSLCV